MTEDEAKTKWCPQARVASPLAFTAPGSTVEQWIGVAGANRGALSERVQVHGGDASNPKSARCIGSACMAWRWAIEPLPAVVDDAVEGDGYCGLAGTPQ